MTIKEEILHELQKGGRKVDFDLLVQGMAPMGSPVEIRSIVKELIGEGKVIQSKKGKLFLPGQFGMFTGRLEVKRLGFAFLRDEDGDIYIGADNKAGAMNDDLVVVRLMGRKETHRNREGQVIEILSETDRRIVGKVSGKFVVTDDERLDDVYIPKKGLGGARNGQKVVATLTRRAAAGKSPEGRIDEVLGEAGVASVEILSYVKRFDLPDTFSQEVMAQAAKAGSQNPNPKGRLDLRRQTVFTIDGPSAKDLDDAVSISKTQRGYELGVHIADVSHYVKEGTELDEQALERGTSVYLADQVIPMLPEALSNGSCSLAEGKDRLTISCIMKIDETGRIQKSRIAKSIIRSRHRMTYGDVNAILDGTNKKLARKYRDIAQDLNDMQKLAKTLRKRREEKGSIDFDLEEAEFSYDADGRVTGVAPRERGKAERLIEEFMLAANRVVAEEYYWREIPFVYRVHEPPDEEKIGAFCTLLNNLGYRMKKQKESVHPKMLQKVLADIKGTPHENIVGQIMLRSLKKAEYSSECLGHFGLSFAYYCHFTSPIRRYPDLEVHRIISLDLAGKLGAKRLETLADKVDGIAKQSSRRERAAMEAERAVDDMKKAEFMLGKEGRQFDGVVSGVLKNVIFVELDSTVEGVIPLSSLQDDYYIFDEKLYCIVGERSGKKISLGDEMRVELAEVSVYPSRVEFAPVN